MEKTEQERNPQGEPFQEFLAGHLEKRAEAAQEQLEEIEQEKQRRKEAAQKWRAWRKNQRPQAKEAARKILDWVDTFLISEPYQNILAFNRKMKPREDGIRGLVSRLRISDIISYKRPSKYGGMESHSQCLSLNLRGELSVLNTVKYGKRYRLRTVGDMLKLVDPPVLIQAAEAIESGRVLDIIKQNLEQELEE